jgi:hypothetical protein
MGAHHCRGDGRFYYFSHYFLVNVRGDEQMKTAEDEEFEMLERQLSGWRKRQIQTQKEGIDKYDLSKIFLQAGWYSEEQLTNLLNKLKDKND